MLIYNFSGRCVYSFVTKRFKWLMISERNKYKAKKMKVKESYLETNHSKNSKSIVGSG